MVNFTPRDCGRHGARRDVEHDDGVVALVFRLEADDPTTRPTPVPMSTANKMCHGPVSRRVERS